MYIKKDFQDGGNSERNTKSTKGTRKNERVLLRFLCFLCSASIYLRPEIPARDYNARTIGRNNFTDGESSMGKSLAAVGLLYVLLSTLAFGQTSNATLGGTVSDASGALIPGVMITATNTQTGIVTTVISNETGAYQFASLQTGAYKVSAE